MIIATEQELKTLFGDDIEKINTFCSIINRILHEIIQRMVTIPFVHLNQETI